MEHGILVECNFYNIIFQKYLSGKFSEYKPKYVRTSILSFFYIDAEVTRGGLSMMPYLAVGFAIMVICSSISTVMSAAYVGQFSYHKVSRFFFAPIFNDFAIL